MSDIKQSKVSNASGGDAVGVGIKRSGFLGILSAVFLVSKAAVLPANALGSLPLTGKWSVIESAALHEQLLDIKFGFPDGSYDHNQLSMSELTQHVNLPRAGSGSRFEVVRTPGSFVFSGAATSGSVVFNASPSYVTNLRGAGYSSITDRDVLDLALFNVSNEMIVQAKALFPEMAPADLLRWQIMGVSVEYAAVVRSIVQNATPQVVAELKTFHISESDLRTYRANHTGPIASDDIFKQKVLDSGKNSNTQL